MASVFPPQPIADISELQVSVTGADCGTLTDGDLRRVFPGSALTGARLDRLREWPRVVVTLNDEVVAVATHQKSDTEMRVPDIGLDVPVAEGAYGSCRCTERDVMNTLLDALELACIAAGCRRIVLSPPVNGGYLERRGYVRVNERCAGGWIEKTIG